MNTASLQSSVQSHFDELVQNGTELGLQAAAYLNGELILDTSAGIMDRTNRRPVTNETLFPVFSTTKGMMATIIHRLVERGLLAYDTPIAEYWPDFAAAGKSNVTLRHALTHTAGLPYIPAGLGLMELNDWKKMCAALAVMPPAYEPGTRVQYHAITYGWLLGECASRVTGLSMEEIWQQEIRTPLNNDSLYCGLPAELDPEVAILEDATAFTGEPPQEPTPESIPFAVQPLSHWLNIGAVRRACMPASNGIMTARAVARHYAALLPGGVDGIELLPQSRVQEATIPIQNPEDPTQISFALGYAPKDTGFGHGGHGGSLGFADPTSGLAFGFARNRLSDVNTADNVLNIVRDWLSTQS